MANQSKAAWPKTPEGTTDWEVVFEDLDSGFIPLIAKSHSPEMAQKTATVIIEKLFTRRSDAEICQQFIYRVKSTVSSHHEDAARIHEDIAVLMREIKRERIEKARVFIERKAAGAAIDRRAGLWWKSENLLKPKVLLPLGALLILIVSGGVYMMLQSTLSSSDVSIQMNSNTADKAASANATPVDPNNIPPKATKPDPLPIWLKTVRWPLLPQKSGERSKFYSVTLFVENLDFKIAVCRKLPSIMDSIYIAFSATMPQTRSARIDEIAKTEDEVRQQINSLYDHGLVDKVAIAQYGTKEFKAASIAPFCKSPLR